MELDDLKQSWNRTDQLYKEEEYNLNKILTGKVNGALDALKLVYKRQLILLPATAAFLAYTCLSNEQLKYNALIWSAVLMLLFLIYGHYRNFKLVQLMQQPAEGGIKQKLEKDLLVLHQKVRQELVLYKVFLGIFMIALEATMFYGLVPAYNEWHHIILPVRLGVYALVFVAQPYITQYFFKQHYGQYINKLQELVDQAS
jgi:hypothetical protein